MKTKEDTEKIIALIYRIEKIHHVYRNSTNTQQTRLFDASAFIVKQLSEFGYPKDFVESLVMFGGEFLKVDSVAHSDFYRKQYPEAFVVFEGK